MDFCHILVIGNRPIKSLEFVYSRDDQNILQKAIETMYLMFLYSKHLIIFIFSFMWHDDDSL